MMMIIIIIFWWFHFLETLWINLVASFFFQNPHSDDEPDLDFLPDPDKIYGPEATSDEPMKSPKKKSSKNVTSDTKWRRHESESSVSGSEDFDADDDGFNSCDYDESADDEDFIKSVAHSKSSDVNIQSVSRYFKLTAS